jgi:uncharacterized protein YndB with AHSA1/START domain
MAENIRVSDVIPAAPERVFAAWLDSEKHSAFTGAKASFDGVGGTYTAWNGYIQGTTFEAEPHHRILQSWRTTEFPAEAPPSRLEVLFEPSTDGTVVTLVHTEIPDGQGAQYEAGWKEHYFAPMKQYFGGSEAIAHSDSPVGEPTAKTRALKSRAAPRKPAKKKKAAKRAAPQKASRRVSRKGASKKKAGSKRGSALRRKRR